MFIDHDDESDVFGIYTNQEKAVEERDQYNRSRYCRQHPENQNEIFTSTAADDILLDGFRTICCEDGVYCAKMEVNDDIENIYFLKMHESGCGESYHHEHSWLYTYVDMETMIKIVGNYFNMEHNRENECEKCANDQCKKEIIESLLVSYSAVVECSFYERTFMEIWDEVINHDIRFSFLENFLHSTVNLLFI